MKRSAIGMIALIGTFLAPPATPATIDLTSIQFQERKLVLFDFSPRPGAPNAKVSAQVMYRQGQARIELSFHSMKPAILFGGDVTCYVLWAVSRDGLLENLGEVLASDPRGKREFATGKKSFALMMTAEPYYLVNAPSELVVFVNDPPQNHSDASTGFTFSGLEEAPRHSMEDISEISWDSDVPLHLLQARKAYELATRNRAEKHARKLWLEAGEALEAADELLERNPRSKALKDQARQSVELSNGAIHIAKRRIEGIELQEMVERRRAEMRALEAQAAEAEARTATATALATEAAVQLMNSEAEAARAEARVENAQNEIAALMRQRKDLEAAVIQMGQRTVELEDETASLHSLLGDALSVVATATDTARGYVISLPDILFDLNEATLKPEAEKPLVKLAGILLVMQGVTLDIEGFTDSTGNEEHNLDLSQRRAVAVLELMAEEGISRDRMTAVGFGMDRPIDDNDTADGRRRNRRVEIVIREG